MTDDDRDELEVRLRRLEGPEAGEMIQADLPWRDLVLLVAGIALASVLLLWWAR